MIPLRDRVTVLRGTEVQDDYTGNFELVFSELGIYPADVQPLKAQEYTDQRQVTVTYYKAVLPAATDVTAVDRLRWRGTDYDVEAEPERHYLGGRLHHLEAVMKVIA